MLNLGTKTLEDSKQGSIASYRSWYPICLVVLRGLPFPGHASRAFHQRGT